MPKKEAGKVEFMNEPNWLRFAEMFLKLEAAHDGMQIESCTVRLKDGRVFTNDTVGQGRKDA